MPHLRGQLCLCCVLALAAVGCEVERSAEPLEPQRLRGGVLHITAGEQAGLALGVVVAAERDVQETLEVAGVVAAAPQRETIVRAPVAGFVTAAARPLPILGAQVAAADELAALKIVATPAEQAALVSAKEDADLQMRQARITMERTLAQLDRLKQTGSDAVAGIKLIDLQEQYDKSKAAYEEARERLPFLPQEPYASALQFKPLPVAAPLAGEVTAIHVTDGQFVLPGDSLWTVSDWRVVWIRAAVFEGDKARVVPTAAAAIETADQRAALAANPVAAPQTARAGSRTVDVVYEAANPGRALLPGQTVRVRVPVSSRERRVILPASALLWDGFGSAWVYLQPTDEEFRRQKVEVAYYLPGATGEAVLARGVRPGERVVTAGVQNLYGEEFKFEIPAEEEGEEEEEED